MSHRWPIAAVVLLLLVAPACKKPTVHQPIVVHIFRDLYSPYAHEVDHRILDFQSSNPRLPSGAPIVVQSINEVDYKAALKGNFNKDVRVEAVILNSSTDIGDNPDLVADASHSVNICGCSEGMSRRRPGVRSPHRHRRPGRRRAGLRELSRTGKVGRTRLLRRLFPYRTG